MCKFFSIILISFLLFTVAEATTLPTGTSFVGLVNQEWKLFIVDPELRIIATEVEPKTPSLDSAKRQLIYVGVDGAIRHIDLTSGIERVIQKASSKVIYRQPVFNREDKVLMVAFPEGRSADTDIVAIDLDKTEGVYPVVTQRAAQFDPAIASNGDLYYGTMSCTTHCGKVIQEIWKMSQLGGSVEQLTLLNAYSKDARRSPDGKWVYFSSNKQGNFHIWRVPSAGGITERLTQGQVTDRHPFFNKEGHLYFLRRTPESISIMYVNDKGISEQVELASNIEDVRDFGIWR